MMFVWAACGVPFGVYAIVQNFNVPLQVQPQCFCAMCLVSWAQCLVYSRKWRVWTATLLAGSIGVGFAGIEVLLVLTLNGPIRRGISWPITLVGVIATVLLIIGYVPVMFEILKRRGRVVGIDFIFLAIDWFGAFFSLMAVVVQETFDILGGFMYIFCAVVEASIFVSHFVWLYRTRNIRKKAAEKERTFEELPEALQWQSQGWKVRPFWMRKQVPEKDVALETVSDIEGMKIVGKEKTCHE